MTSVPSSTKLTDLTSAQSTQLCSDIGAYEQKALGPDLCTLEGLVAADDLMFLGITPTNADLQSTCTSAYNACLSGDAASPFSSSSSCTDTSTTPSTCTATVGDLETCLADSTTAEKQAFTKVPSCSNLTAASLAAFLATDGGAGPPEPASCSKYDAVCDGGSDGGFTAHRRLLRRRF